MKTYTVTFPQDVPHYGVLEIQALDDATALAEAKALWASVQNGGQDGPDMYDADWSSTVCNRIVEILDPQLNQVACDVPLDAYRLEYGESEPLKGLETAIQILKRIADVLHYEDGLPVTFLESRQIEDLYADAIGQTDELQTIAAKARVSK